MNFTIATNYCLELCKERGKAMFKARLFSFEDSGIYFKKYGISPDKHFDRLCKNYGTDAAVEIVDRNMQKAWESKRKKEKEEEERQQRILDMECPF